MQVPESPPTAQCYEICSAQNIGTDFFEIVCDLAPLGPPVAAGPARAVAVHDPAGGTNLFPAYAESSGFKPYCAFGEDAHGRDFYCTWDTTLGSRELTAVAVHGGPDDDIVQFWWDVGSTEFNLDVFSGFEGDLFTGTARGFGGDDQLLGSRSTASVYQDRLFGGANADQICGFHGDDTANGESGADLVCGDANNDDLEGGLANDTLCGLTGVDSLVAGDGNDFLDHGGNSGDSNDGGPGTDECNSVSDTNCESGHLATSFCVP